MKIPYQFQPAHCSLPSPSTPDPQQRGTPMKKQHKSLFPIPCPLSPVPFFFLLSLFSFSCASPPDSLKPQTTAAQAGPFFTGDGGKGLTLAVLEPEGRGLLPSEQWVLSLAQSSLTGDFNKYSAMTIVDRQNLEKTLAEQAQSLSGIYSEADYVKIGELTNARLIVSGAVTKTASGYMLELSVTDVESGERRASFPPQAVSAEALENLSAVKEASAELLGQLGVKLTEVGLAELKKAAAPNTVQAEAALAKGIRAQRQGTEVAALSYYFQAAALDPSLFEAVNRSSIISANISSGNIREDALNDIQWRREWLARLTETEEFFDEFFRNESLHFTLFYSTGIKQGEIDYLNETVSLSIDTNLHGSYRWAYSIEQALQMLYNGLEATKRKEAWGFANWPRQGVTNLKSFEKRSENFSLTFDLVNNMNKIIGSQILLVAGAWEFIIKNGIAIQISSDNKQTVFFTGIKIDDITDNLEVRITSVNGIEAEHQVRDGILQIKALSLEKWELFVNSPFSIKNGVVTSYKGSGDDIIIPNLWDDLVISIDNSVFSSKNLTSVIIPNGIISIGERAFENNRLARISIPGNVSIGPYAFGRSKNQFIRREEDQTSNDNLNDSLYELFFGWRYYSSGGNIYREKSKEGTFSRYYEKKGKKAGTYINCGGGWLLR
ncbi:MAG: leucine-rich repeat domain-containing protein [Treponema sp.]|nr:leucine-rich repeat domain-containing protein [Treponema sp.]